MQNLPDTSTRPLRSYRLPDPDLGPFTLEARQLVMDEGLHPNWRQIEEPLAVRITYGLYETAKGQVVFCETHQDRSGTQTRNKIITAKNLEAFFRLRSNAIEPSTLETLLYSLVANINGGE